MSRGGTPQPELRAQGVAVLLAYAGQILPPKRGVDGRTIPGIECQGYQEVWVRAVGFKSPTAAERCLSEARRILEEAGLQIVAHRDGFTVRRCKEVV